MRSFSGLLLLIVAIAIVALAFMNPQMNDFETFAADHLETELADQIQERTGASDSGLGGLLARAGAGIASQYLDRVATRDNYVVASVYTVDLDGPDASKLEWEFLGIAGRFIPLEVPEKNR
jgi:hypothetical protein